MASLTSPRRTDDHERATVRLKASEAVRDRPEADVDPVSWPVAAVVGGLLSAAVGWVLTSGVVTVGWLTGATTGLATALELGTRLWLLSGGVPVRIGSLEVSLVPWGVTAVTAFVLWRFGGYAVRRVRPSSSAGPLAVASVVTLTYALPVLGAAIFFGEPWRAPGRWVAVLVVLLLAAWGGACARLDRPLAAGWPAVLRGLPFAVVVAQVVLLVAGATVLVLALSHGWDQVVSLTRALRAGTVGTVLLVVLQSAVLPNALVWSGSYALGAGFSLGNGSVVTPAATSLGVLPGLPVLGALPAVGPGAASQLWWLVAAVLAGTVAAWCALRGGPGTAPRRIDSSAVLGGLAGVCSALVFTGLAWTTSGDLGSQRLSGLGPRLLPLLVMSATTLGLSGLITGAVVGIVRHVRRGEDTRDPEETGVVDEEHGDREDHEDTVEVTSEVGSSSVTAAEGPTPSR